MAIDRNSATAMFLRGMLEELMAARLKSVARPGYDWDKTQVLRGELAAYRKIYNEVALIPIDDEDSDE